MKFFIVFALIAAVATATPIKPTMVSGNDAEIAQIVAAIQSPSTDPATAAALVPMLFDLLGLSPIAVGPAIVEAGTSPISVGPAIVDFHPIAVGPEMIDFPVPAEAIMPSPVVQPAASGSSPLVQIIVNVRQSESSPAVIAPAPVDTPVIDEVYVPGPVNVVEQVDAPEQVINPILVVDPIIPGPVNVVDNVDAPVVPSPVVIGTPALPEVVVPSPVVVGNPIIPAPVVVLPDILN